MIDDEINRRVAEIEGWAGALLDDFPKEGAAACNAWEWSRADKDGSRHIQCSPPPYTTDWAWCGPLIEKHGIDLHWQPDDENGDKWMAYSFGINGMLAETPQIAICAAVMAANQNRQPTTSGHWTGLGDK